MWIWLPRLVPILIHRVDTNLWGYVFRCDHQNLSLAVYIAVSIPITRPFAKIDRLVRRLGILACCKGMFLILLCSTVSLDVKAWGELGHHVVASVAQQQLSTNAAMQTQRLLNLEPGQTLVSISTWADEHRDSTTSRWHFVNLPPDSCLYNEARDCPGGDCVVRAIEDQLVVLKSDPSEIKRLQALKFLVHFVADLHQPLHSGFAHDRGGNQYQININGIGSNLHALWDIGLVNHAGANLGVWIEKFNRLPKLTGSMSLNPAQMANESCEIVASRGFYPTHNVPEEYLDRFAPFVASQLEKAASRLARLLNSVWP